MRQPGGFFIRIYLQQDIHLKPHQEVMEAEVVAAEVVRLVQVPACIALA